jgi:RimJ/RimL family protein N-acetyltransferase
MVFVLHGKGLHNMRSLVQKTDALNPRFRSYLRFVEPEDAAFICALRGDDRLNRHLNASAADVGQQREWLVRYKEREHAGSEFYFVIVSDQQDRGVIRMYDFRAQWSFCWGSWIVPPPRISGLVTFSAVTMYEIGFDALGFQQCHFEVRRANETVNAFHLRAGAERTGEDSESFFYRYTPEAYRSFRSNSAQQLKDHRVEPRSMA